MQSGLWKAKTGGGILENKDNSLSQRRQKPEQGRGEGNGGKELKKLVWERLALDREG